MTWKAARSISGKLCILPPFGGHSISKVLLFTAWTSASLLHELPARGDFGLLAIVDLTLRIVQAPSSFLRQ